VAMGVCEREKGLKALLADGNSEGPQPKMETAINVLLTPMGTFLQLKTLKLPHLL